MLYNFFIQQKVEEKSIQFSHIDGNEWLNGWRRGFCGVIKCILGIMAGQ